MKTRESEAGKVVYFEGEGKPFLPGTVRAVVDYLRANEGLRRVVVFTAEGDGPLALASALAGTGVQVIATTFPYGQPARADAEGAERIVTGIVDEEVRGKLVDAGVQIVQGVLPFQDILIPGAYDPKMQAIIHTLRLFGGGTELCIQATVMACDAGAVQHGEEIVAMAADTALRVVAARKAVMFSPFEGLEVREIICRPRRLPVTRPRTAGHREAAASSSAH
ncbi:MAG: hypothetical protein ACM3RP_02200 [Chitinophagales bacterium]